MLKTTEWLAVYGAALATINVVWTMTRARSKIKVKLAPGHELVGEDYDFGLEIHIQNHSAHSIHLMNIRTLIPDYHFDYLGFVSHLIRFRSLHPHWSWSATSFPFSEQPTALPTTLDARQSVRLFMSDTNFDDWLKYNKRPMIRVVVSDQLGRNHFSNIVRFTVQPVFVEQDEAGAVKTL
ncbi:hypothetical protein [Hyphomonas sp.]|uniref:hypothetical protein n=1 Tax=Hyphomonas sp. TaxID=87 RepID=UPI00391D7583